MLKIVAYVLLFLLLYCTGVEPLLANKFETISGGVSGLDHKEKIMFMKEISFYTGIFLLFLAVLALLTRTRFEGFIGYTSKNETSAAIKGAMVLIIAGVILMGLGYL